MFSGDASGPNIITAGSPGDISIMQNTKNVAPSKTGISIKNLFIIYLDIFIKHLL
jgi:hypothetical protein